MAVELETYYVCSTCKYEVCCATSAIVVSDILAKTPICSDKRQFTSMNTRGNNQWLVFFC